MHGNVEDIGFHSGEYWSSSLFTTNWANSHDEDFASIVHVGTGKVDYQLKNSFKTAFRPVRDASDK